MQRVIVASLFALASLFAVPAIAADPAAAATPCCAVPTTPPPPPPPLPLPPLPVTNLLGCWENDLLNVNTVDSVTGSMGGFAKVTLSFCISPGFMNPDGTQNYQGNVSWFVDGATANIFYVPAAVSGRRPYMRVTLFLPLTRYGKGSEYFTLDYQVYLSSTEDYAWGTLSGTRVEPDTRPNSSMYFDVPTETFSGTTRMWKQDPGNGKG